MRVLPFWEREKSEDCIAVGVSYTMKPSIEFSGWPASPSFNEDQSAGISTSSLEPRPPRPTLSNRVEDLVTPCENRAAMSLLPLPGKWI